jgi:deferrochelatase/peroxidase EfeB
MSLAARPRIVAPTAVAAQAAATRLLAPVLPQVQGIALRGYQLNPPPDLGQPRKLMFARFFTLVVADKAAAGRRVASFVDGSAPGFQIRSAADWGPVRPPTCLNIGFSFRGLVAFGYDATTLRSPAWFGSPSHTPFVNGSAASAATVGDVADSAPAEWRVDDRGFDVMLGLWAKDLDTLESASADLRALLADGFETPAEFTSQDLADDMVYFQYTDGIAQPLLDIDPYYRRPDGGQTLVDDGAFVLGIATTPYFQGVNVPQEIGEFGTFAAFRMLEQKVEEFDAFVEQQRAQVASLYNIPDAISRDAMKALMVGRWPANGTPVALYPVAGATALPPDLPYDQINDFLYDDYGANCPYSSHIRRTNPRPNTPIDSDPSIHRIMRRAMPYQIPYDASDRNKPGTERGLMGLFIGASLRDSFEFLMDTWVNGGNSSGLPYPASIDAADPIIGHNLGAPPWTFSVIQPPSNPPDPINVASFTLPPPPSFTNFVVTRGSAYVFLPGMSAIATIAAQATTIA